MSAHDPKRTLYRAVKPRAILPMVRAGFMLDLLRCGREHRRHRACCAIFLQSYATQKKSEASGSAHLMRKSWVARLQAIVSGTCQTIPTPNALPCALMPSRLSYFAAG